VAACKQAEKQERKEIGIMRTGVRVLALVATVLLPGAALADLTPACQRAVARGGAKFARVALKIGQRCAMRAGVAACRPRVGKPTGNAAVDAAIARAEGRLAARVSEGCVGSDLAPFARRCPDPTGPPLSLAELVACLRDTHLDRVGSMLAVEFPSPALQAAAASGCSTGETCQCSCSPSGAFLSPSGDAF
jgi:hypothetical protein